MGAEEDMELLVYNFGCHPPLRSRSHVSDIAKPSSPSSTLYHCICLYPIPTVSLPFQHLQLGSLTPVGGGNSPSATMPPSKSSLLAMSRPLGGDSDVEDQPSSDERQDGKDARAQRFQVDLSGNRFHEVR